jgi:hypothetical protein
MICLFHLLFTLIVTCLFAQNVNRTIDTYRDVLSSCCRDSVVTCLNYIPLKSSNVKFVMYYTKEIEHHAAYAAKINAIYGMIYNIDMVLVNSSSSDQFDTEDVRWNKVKIFLDLLEAKDPAVDYYIWLDADLVFVDFSFNIKSIMEQNPNVDIIMSREVNPANGIANTGSMLVKNTNWSLMFFQKWWLDYDHSAAMDQHAFENLLSRQSESFSSSNRVLLLPETAINSKFPGLWTHNDSLPILHLAGESNFIREEIFRLGWQNLCSSVASSSHAENNEENDNNKNSNNLFSKIITRQLLDSIDYLSLHLQEWDQIIEKSHFFLNQTMNSQLFELSDVQQVI